MKIVYLLSAAALALAPAVVNAQDANVEGRVTKLEKEMRSVQRKVFPDGAGKFFEPDIQADPAGRHAVRGLGIWTRSSGGWPSWSIPM